MKNEPLKILYEDNDIIVCHKPAGVATESANIRAMDLVSLIKVHLAQNKESSGAYLGVIHRLDQPVSGILVFAKNPAAAANLSRQVQTDDMGKYYMAVVQGDMSDVNIEADSIETLDDGSFALTNYLLKDSKTNMAVIAKKNQKGSDGKPAKEARLSYRVLSYNSEENTSLLKVKLFTGRFHQIRIQLSNIGHPIVGDVKYGAEPSQAMTGAKNNFGLCANELHFRHPSTGKEMIFTIEE